MEDVFIRKLDSKELKELIAEYRTGTPGPLDLGQRFYKICFAAQEVDLPINLYFEQQHLDEFAFPYEYIANSAGNHLCLRDSGTLVRVINKNIEQQFLTLPVQVLIVIAIPEGFPNLRADDQINDVQARLGSYFNNEIVQFTIIKGPDTIKKIGNAVRENQFDIVEFIAHGTDDDNGKGGVVFLEGSNSQKIPVDGNKLSATLNSNGHSSPSIVLLNVCRSSGGRAPNQGWYASVAWHLLDKVPIVIAMQIPVRDDLAAHASVTFYDCLFDLKLIEQCVRAMRQCFVGDDDGDGWVSPILAKNREVKTDVFAGQAFKRLSNLNCINKEVKRRLTNYPDLIDYLHEIDERDLHLIHGTGNIANKIIESLSGKLGVPV